MWITVHVAGGTYLCVCVCVVCVWGGVTGSTCYHHVLQIKFSTSSWYISCVKNGFLNLMNNIYSSWDYVCNDVLYCSKSFTRLQQDLREYLPRRPQWINILQHPGSGGKSQLANSSIHHEGVAPSKVGNAWPGVAAGDRAEDVSRGPRGDGNFVADLSGSEGVESRTPNRVACHPQLCLEKWSIH